MIFCQKKKKKLQVFNCQIKYLKTASPSPRNSSPSALLSASSCPHCDFVVFYCPLLFLTAPCCFLPPLLPSTAPCCSLVALCCPLLSLLLCPALCCPLLFIITCCCFVLPSAALCCLLYPLLLYAALCCHLLLYPALCFPQRSCSPLFTAQLCCAPLVSFSPQAALSCPLSLRLCGSSYLTVTLCPDAVWVWLTRDPHQEVRGFFPPLYT